MDLKMPHKTPFSLTINTRLAVFLAAAFLMAGCQTAVRPASTGPVDVPREFRAGWIATVANIDWPSRPGLSTEQQKAELIAMLDKAVELNLNAIVFQVRPHCDALYNSPYEPWSEYLTGTAGKAPDPFYDPLQFAVEESHKRGLELHTWFNPYRAWHPSAKSEIPDNHLSKTHPNLVKKYGRYLWMDPGEPETRAHCLKVVMDVVKRYDIDGVHFDDYFYPYKERGEDGKILDFPDDESWNDYLAAGGKLARNDWRRESVNTFIKDLYTAIKAEKPSVKFGISPFGIWQPGYPPQVVGFNQHEELYADAKLWLRKGWVDYYTPQLYWPIAAPEQSYIALLQWWHEQNPKDRHLWPGNAPYRIGDGSGRSVAASEIIHQIQWTRILNSPRRSQNDINGSGNVFFSYKVFMSNKGNINDLLKEKVYQRPALVPASPWLASKRIASPEASVTRGEDVFLLRVSPGSDEPVRHWVVYKNEGAGKWSWRIIPGGQRDIPLDVNKPVDFLITAIDRAGVESHPTFIRTAAVPAEVAAQAAK